MDILTRLDACAECEQAPLAPLLTDAAAEIRKLRHDAELWQKHAPAIQQMLAALDTVAAAAGSPWQAQLAQTRREVQALPSAGRAPAAQCVPLALSLP